MTALGSTLALVTATASGLTAGVFLGFSALVMPALRTRPPAEALAAMQAVNLVAPRSLLMLPLLLSAAGSVAVGGHAVLDPQAAGSAAAWARYAAGWTWFNAVRSGLALVSAIALVGGVLRARPAG